MHQFIKKFFLEPRASTPNIPSLFKVHFPLERQPRVQRHLTTVEKDKGRKCLWSEFFCYSSWSKAMEYLWVAFRDLIAHSIMELRRLINTLAYSVLYLGASEGIMKSYFPFQCQDCYWDLWRFISSPYTTRMANVMARNNLAWYIFGWCSSWLYSKHFGMFWFLFFILSVWGKFPGYFCKGEKCCLSKHMGTSWGDFFILSCP